MDSKTYKLRTIEDIYDKIPSDKIDVFFQELAALIKKCQSLRELLQNLGKINGLESDQCYAKFPGEVEWIDDGKGEMSINTTINGKDFINVRTVVK